MEVFAPNLLFARQFPPLRVLLLFGSDSQQSYPLRQCLSENNASSTTSIPWIIYLGERLPRLHRASPQWPSLPHRDRCARWWYLPYQGTYHPVLFNHYASRRTTCLCSTGAGAQGQSSIYFRALDFAAPADTSHSFSPSALKARARARAEVSATDAQAIDQPSPSPSLSSSKGADAC